MLHEGATDRTWRVRRIRRLRQWHQSRSAGRERKPMTAEQLAAAVKEVEEVYGSAVEKLRHVVRGRMDAWPHGSAMRADYERMAALPADALVDELFALMFPNPERVNCPPYRILMELGTRTRGLDDPAFEHIGRCYPCIVELRRLVRAYEPPYPS